MKKIFGIIILLSIVLIFFTSCEKRCICKYLDDGSEEIVYSAYSKKECNDWDKYQKWQHRN